MADQDIILEVKIETGEAAKSLKQLKAEYKDHQKGLEGLAVGSKAYVEQLEKLGKIKDDIGDLNSEIKAFNPEGKIAAFGNVVSGLASGFQAAQGAAALFGNSGEEVQKTLLKVQAVMAFTEGIKGIAGLSDGFKVLGNVIKSNPIYLIGSIIIGIGTALFALKDKIGFVGDAFDFLGDIIGKVVQGGKDFLDFLGLTNFEMEKMSDSIINSSKRISNAITSRYDSEIAAAKRAGKETELLEIAKLHAITKQNDAIIASLRLRWQKEGQLNEDSKKELEERLAQNVKAYESIQNLSDQYKDRGVAKQKEVTTKYNAELDKRKSDHQKHLDALADAENAEADKYDAKRAARKAKAKEEELKGYEDAVALANKSLEEYDREQLAKAELKAVYTNGDITSQLALLEEKKRIELENTELTESERLLIKEKYAQQAQTLEKKNQTESFQRAQDLVGALQSLSDLYFSVKAANTKKGSAAELKAAKDQFKINKALSITSATISGIQGVVNALSAQSVVPEPFGTALKVASAIGVGLAAAANISKIAGTQFEGGGGGGGGSVSMSMPSAPTINPPNSNTSQINADGSVKPQQKLPDQKVYVTEGDISQTQKKVSVIESNAKI